MAFWFTKQPAQKPKVRRASTGGNSRAVALNKPLLARLGCSACPLDKEPCQTPKMKPYLVAGAPVYILAEAPGAHEDERSKKPLTGDSGRLLRECIPKGQNPSRDNIVNCRPKNNRTPTDQEAACCFPRRVKWIEEIKPKLILGLGKVPLKALLNSADMEGRRGRLFAVKIGNHRCWFLPTYHPAFLLHSASRRKAKYGNKTADPFSGKFGECFRRDVNRAFTLVAAGLPEPCVDRILPDDVLTFDGSRESDFGEVAKLLKAAIKAPIKAIDIETKGLRPYSKGAAIMTVALSFEQEVMPHNTSHNGRQEKNKTKGVHFAFAVDHPDTKWTPLQRQMILSTLEAILKDDTTKVAHNTPFELEWFIWLFGRKVVNHAAWECTQMQAHFLDERRGKSYGGEEKHRATYQSLAFLTEQHFGVSYKGDFKLNKSDMSRSPLADTLTYNGLDTGWTLRVYRHQDSALRKAGLHSAYLEALPRQASVALMQALGVSVDQEKLKHTQGFLQAGIDADLFNINDLPIVKKYIQDNGSFNPLSNDCLTIFKDKRYLNRPEVRKVIKKNRVMDRDQPSEAKRAYETKLALGEAEEVVYSVDKTVLSQMTDQPLAELVLRLRNKTKLKSTYVDGLVLGKGRLIYPDGKIHCNFNTTFTETGRTSSDDPNMQNFPQRVDSWVREPIVPEPGQVLVAFDYGQLEACTAAMCSRDEALVKALENDYDIHMDFTEKVVAVYPALLEGRTMKQLRSIIKNKFVFPAIFGAASGSISDYLGGVPEDIIKGLMDTLWDKYHGLKSWQDETLKLYRKHGYIESPTGRRHRYPLNRNQVINFPIQSVACDIVCYAMNELSYRAVNTDNWNIHPRLNIHDDLTFSVDKSAFDESVETIATVMLKPPFKCVNVPLSVKASVGDNWYEMEEVGQFWSHKDV